MSRFLERRMTKQHIKRHTTLWRYIWYDARHTNRHTTMRYVALSIGRWPRHFQENIKSPNTCVVSQCCSSYRLWRKTAMCCFVCRFVCLVYDNATWHAIVCCSICVVLSLFFLFFSRKFYLNTWHTKFHLTKLYDVLHNMEQISRDYQVSTSDLVNYCRWSNEIYYFTCCGRSAHWNISVRLATQSCHDPLILLNSHC